jgi:two-component system cell cycle sensor histidine kinase/response regulator CckA
LPEAEVPSFRRMLPGAVHRESIDLRALLDGLVADFEVSAGPRGVTFDALAFADEVSADPILLRQLLLTLIDHAVQRAPDGTSVTLLVSPRPGRVEFRVADQGSPLSPDTRQKVFAPNAFGVQKNGFGLAYCRLVAEAHGGNFWLVETDAGSVVCVALPIAPVSTRRGAARTTSGTQPRADYVVPEAAPQTILVVDDEPLIRASVARALEGKGYRVIEADSAARALEYLMFRQQPPALLVSDVGLPGVSGADLVRQAKLLNPTLPTLLISATSKQSLVQEGVIREDTDLLQKPFSSADLFAKLEKLLPQPSSVTTRAG